MAEHNKNDAMQADSCPLLGIDFTDVKAEHGPVGLAKAWHVIKTMAGNKTAVCRFHDSKTGLMDAIEMSEFYVDVSKDEHIALLITLSHKKQTQETIMYSPWLERYGMDEIAKMPGIPYSQVIVRNARGRWLPVLEYWNDEKKQP